MLNKIFIRVKHVSEFTRSGLKPAALLKGAQVMSHVPGHGFSSVPTSVEDSFYFD